jgi:hypothetical protein
LRYESTPYLQDDIQKGRKMSEKCPYCDAELEIDHDDGYGYDENEKHNQECRNCGKSFVYTTSMLYAYELEQADCLNEGEHSFEPIFGVPKELFVGMERCKVCGEERRVNIQRTFLPLVNEDRIKEWSLLLERGLI